MFGTNERTRIAICAVLMVVVMPGVGFPAFTRKHQVTGLHAGMTQTEIAHRDTSKHVLDRTTWDSVYTLDQAKRGQTEYSQTCAKCHQESMAGADEAPALTGSSFMSNWNTVKLSELHERVLTGMPPDSPGAYGKKQVTDVIAYILKFNGFPPGATELTEENDALKTIKFQATKP